MMRTPTPIPFREWVLTRRPTDTARGAFIRAARRRITDLPRWPRGFDEVLFPALHWPEEIEAGARRAWSDYRRATGAPPARPYDYEREYWRAYERRYDELAAECAPRATPLAPVR